MIDNPAYIKFKAYCETNNLSKEQVEALTKKQIKEVAAVSIGVSSQLSDNFADNMKNHYLREVWINEGDVVISFLLDNLSATAKAKYPELAIEKKRVGEQFVYTLWLEGSPKGSALDSEV